VTDSRPAGGHAGGSSSLRGTRNTCWPPGPADTDRVSAGPDRLPVGHHL